MVTPRGFAGSLSLLIVMLSRLIIPSLQPKLTARPRSLQDQKNSVGANSALTKACREKFGSQQVGTTQTPSNSSHRDFKMGLRPCEDSRFGQRKGGVWS